MTKPRMLRYTSLCLLIMVLAGLLPIQRAAAQPSRPAIEPELTRKNPEKIYAEGLKESGAPSLALNVQASADTLAVGDSATITVVVANQSAFPARSVAVSLPLPAGTEPADTAGFDTAAGAWHWTVERLNGRAEQAFSATVRLTALPAGEALLVRPSLSAVGLPFALSAVGGALVESTAGGSAAFTPGKAARLRSGDNRVEVSVPADLLDEGLRLSYRTLAEKRQATKDLKAPPAIVGFKRGLGTFFLDATDANGRPVHTFTKPLTISVRYTPEQLLARGIAEGDLTIFWYDDKAGQWVPQPTVVDPNTRTASTRVDHFSAYALGDGSSPSEAFIPSLKSWQVGLYSGSANYSPPIEVPAGAAGLKPNLELSYSSTATDGKGGMRRTQQAGWVGKGWSLDTGSIAFNKAPVYSNEYNHYSVVMNGMAFDLVRAEALPGNTGVNDPDPTHWAWRPTDENFLKVRVVANGVSTASRGGFQNGVAKPRHTWQVWTKDGTRYDFAEDLWWGWNNCDSGGSMDMETYKWQLSQIVDVHGNVITYQYGRASHSGHLVTCDWWNNGQGTVDRDSWPTAITWGGHLNAQGVRDAADRYKVEFVSDTRESDTAFEGTENQYGAVSATAGWGHVRETRRLDLIRVLSMPGGAWEVVREYQFGYDYSLLSDYNAVSGTSFVADTGTPKLTLKSITRVGKYDAPVTFASPVGTPGTPGTRPGLPPMTFTYGTERGDSSKPYPTNGAWNRLTQVNNGQGGTVKFTYETIEAVTNDPVFRNNRRVTSKTTTDGRDTSATWTYAYTNPAYNWLGRNITGRAQEPLHPNSATLYYARNAVFGHDYTGNAEPFTAARPYTQFRGHSQVVETAPDGTTTEHSYYQGDVNCTPTAASSHAAINADACFIQLRTREILKGREYRTAVRSAAGALMTQTDHTFAVTFLDYSYLPIRGLWRAFAYENQTIEATYEGGATPLTRRTTFDYSPTAQSDGQAYGNLYRKDEYDAANALYRRTYYSYETLNTAGQYIVDRRRAETVLDGQNRILAHTNYFYDGNTTQFAIGARGLLTLVRKYYDLPLATSAVNVTLHSVDTSYGYDAYGNQTSVTTYAQPGWKINNGSATTWSPPGNESAATTTTTVYDDPATTTVNEAPWGLSLKVIQPPINGFSLTEQAGYDLRMGTLTSVTDANGNVTSAQYDVFGRLERIIKPGDTAALPTIRAEYGDTEQPFRYTTFTRLDSGVSGAVQIASQFYDGLGRKIQTKTESTNNSQSVVVDTQYNGLDQIVRTSQPRFLNDTNVTITQYTPTPASGINWTTQTYDAIGRDHTLTTPDGAQTRHVYVINGALMMHNVIDPNRHRVQYRSDVFGRLVGVGEIKGTCGNWGYTCAPGETVWAADGTTTYTYSPLDLLTSVSDAAGNQTSMTYDSLGRKLTMSDPDMGAWSYAYDVDGNLLSQRDAKNQTIAFTYDALNRLTRKYDPAGGASGLNVTYRYDELNSTTHTNGRGQRTSMLDASGSQRWGYDERGQVIRQSQTINDQGVGYVTDISRTYDANGRLKTLTYPTGETLSYVYNDAGQQLAISSSLGGSFLSDASYDALGQALLVTFGNAVDTTYSYDAVSKRLSTINATGSKGTVFQRAYTYDPAGNVRTIANPLGSETLRYSYDDRDRLTAACAVASAASATCLGGSTFNQTYAYDTIGNLTSKAGVAYTYPTNGVRPHAVATVGGQAYSYDNNGNLLTGGGRTYTWNSENQPTQIVSGGTTETYVYDGDNQRVKKVSTVNGVTTTTRYVGGLVEYTTGNKVVSSYAGIAVRTSTGNPTVTNQGTIVYLHSDHLGSVSVTTSGGGAISTWGAIVEAQNFDPWGAVRSGGIASTEFNYTGQRKDAGTGLLFYNARYYDPALGRFLSADSIVPVANAGSQEIGRNNDMALRSLTVDFHEKDFVEGMNAENSFMISDGFWFQLSDQQKNSEGAKHPWGPSNAQLLNRYSYVLNNPLSYTDPNGHWPCIVFLDDNCVAYIDTKAGKIFAKGGHAWLPWASLIPVVGGVFGAIDAGIYFAEGKIVMGAFTIILAFIPAKKLPAGGYGVDAAKNLLINFINNLINIPSGKSSGKPNLAAAARPRSTPVLRSPSTPTTTRRNNSCVPCVK